ncbi:recombinase XerC [Collibacillus ludicampi]|uniref:Recombinase XerC n=1 Tax=Collibacillus ludicampi TaxID=2771369 RepID=A0AAV4LIR9_9BACL|nr:tyrosine-type recombinase/integrase [Collibacillus ludicampi]GIM47655.1 recombinase XerC [Collibacillus ludicampi]
MDIARVIEEHMAGKSDQTKRMYGYWLGRFQNWLLDSDGNLESLTRADVQQYIDWMLAHKKSPSTVSIALSAIRSWARWTGQDHAVMNLRTVRPPKVTELAPQSLERNERNRLLREVERDGNLRDIAIVYVLLYTGLRVSELCGLDREDVTIGERSGQVIVRKGKRAKARVVPLPAEARHHVSRYMAVRKDQEPALFLSNYGQRISVRQVQRILAKYGTHPHALRHTYCRTLVSKGMDLAAVAELAGHSDVNMMRRYAKPTQEELERAVEEAFVKPTGLD